jgi:hypothetical protein
MREEARMLMEDAEYHFRGAADTLVEAGNSLRMCHAHMKQLWPLLAEVKRLLAESLEIEIADKR